MVAETVEEKDLSDVGRNNEVKASGRPFDIGDDFFIIPLIVAPFLEGSTLDNAPVYKVKSPRDRPSPPHYFLPLCLVESNPQSNELL